MGLVFQQKSGATPGSLASLYYILLRQPWLFCGGAGRARPGVLLGLGWPQIIPGPADLGNSGNFRKKIGKIRRIKRFTCDISNESRWNAGSHKNTRFFKEQIWKYLKNCRKKLSPQGRPPASRNTNAVLCSELVTQCSRPPGTYGHLTWWLGLKIHFA